MHEDITQTEKGEMQIVSIQWRPWISTSGSWQYLHLLYSTMGKCHWYHLMKPLVNKNWDALYFLYFEGKFSRCISAELMLCFNFTGKPMDWYFRIVQNDNLILAIAYQIDCYCTIWKIVWRLLKHQIISTNKSHVALMKVVRDMYCASTLCLTGGNCVDVMPDLGKMQRRFSARPEIVALLLAPRQSWVDSLVTLPIQTGLNSEGKETIGWMTKATILYTPLIFLDETYNASSEAHVKNQIAMMR